MGATGDLRALASRPTASCSPPTAWGSWGPPYVNGRPGRPGAGRAAPAGRGRRALRDRRGCACSPRRSLAGTGRLTGDRRPVRGRLPAWAWSRPNTVALALADHTATSPGAASALLGVLPVRGRRARRAGGGGSGDADRGADGGHDRGADARGRGGPATDRGAAASRGGVTGRRRRRSRCLRRRSG